MEADIYLELISKYSNNINFDALLEKVSAKYSVVVVLNDTRVKHLLRIESAVEVIGYLLNEIEKLTKETFKTTFSLGVIKKEVHHITEQLSALLREVIELYDVMKDSQQKNEVAFNAVKELSKNISNFEKSAFLIKESEEEIVDEMINKQIPFFKQMIEREIIDFDNDVFKQHTQDILFGTSVLQILNLSQTFRFFNRLRELHCEFSYILLHIYLKENCPKKVKLATGDNDKVNKISMTYLDELLARFTELGYATVDMVNVCRKNYCSVVINRKRLIKNYLQKQQYQIQQLNNLQIILRIIYDLSEKNDNLVGKLIKTTQLYEKVHSILERPWPSLKVAAGTYSFSESLTSVNETNANIDLYAKMNNNLL